MVVRLRLARHGTRSNPFYHLVAIQNTKARDALPIEKLGEYDPVPRPEFDRPAHAGRRAGENRPGYNGEVIQSGIHEKPVMRKRLEWNEDRIRYWLGVGAQPSKPVFRLLHRVRISIRANIRRALFPRTRSTSMCGLAHHRSPTPNRAAKSRRRNKHIRAVCIVPAIVARNCACAQDSVPKHVCCDQRMFT